MSFKSTFIPSLLISCFSASALAADVDIIFTDAPGSGFYDTAVITPIDGNSGVTLGEQRRIALTDAMEEVALEIDSAVPIKVEASFAALECDAFSAVLGAAGPTTALWGFNGAPDANTLYPIAVANALAGVDLHTGIADITVTMNASIDNNNACLDQTDWYYGLNAAGPASAMNFKEVAVHELTHGLGFLTFVDPQTGERFLGRDDAFSRKLFDSQTNKYWSDMTDSERLTSHSSTVVWRGDRANCIAADLHLGTQLVGGEYYPEMYSPDPIEFGSSISHWSDELSPNAVMEPRTNATPLLALTGADKSLLADIGWQGIFADSNGNGIDDCLEDLPPVETTTESFEAAALPVGWSKPVAANAGWSLSQAQFSDGAVSLKADDVSDGQTAEIEWLGNFAAGAVSFDIKVSSELHFDFLIFSVDGNEKFRVSGNENWQSKSVILTEGQHLLSWKYLKDNSVSNLEDTAWIDNIAYVAAGTDTDGDGWLDSNDAFPTDPAEWLDTDGDGFGDNADALPNDPLETVDTDNDGVGNNADTDDDGDGISDVVENSYDFLDSLNYADANLDFDGDGYSNLEELVLGSLPDNSADLPSVQVADMPAANYGDIICSIAEGASNVAVHPASEEIYIAKPGSSAIDVLSIYGGACISRAIPLQQAVKDISFSPDGNSYYVTPVAKAELHIYNVVDDALVAVVPLPSEGYEVVATEREIYISGSDIMRVDVATSSYISSFGRPITHSNEFIELSPDGNRLFIANQGISPATVGAFDISAAEPVFLGTNSHGNLGSMTQSLSADPNRGEFVSIASSDGNAGVFTIHKLNAETFVSEGEFNLSSGHFPFAIEYSRDGKSVYIVNDSGQVKVWDSNTLVQRSSILVTGTPEALIESSTAKFLVAIDDQQIQVIYLSAKGVNSAALESDFDSDGDSDLIWRHELSGETALWTMQDALVDQKLHLGVISDTEWKVISTGDFNADGHSDMLWRHASQGWTSLWTFNNGAIINKKSLGTISDLNWQIVAEGDFDGDGDTDLLWQHSVSGAMTEWVVENSEVIGRQYLGAVGPADWSIVSADDFDGDRQSDLLWRNLSTGEIVLWSMSAGVVSSKATVGIVPDMDWAIATTGDFNGDGNSDIIWHHNTGGWTSIWAMNGAAIANRSSLGTISKSDWTIEKLGDYDGDGDADLIWRGVNSGWVNVWQLQEGAVTAKNYVANVSSEWKLQ